MKTIIAFCSLALIACNSDPASSTATEKKDTIATDTVTNALRDKPADTTIIDMHNAENALDVFGKYTGTLPCADCEGIKTTLELNEDNTFVLTEKYLGKKSGKFTAKGKWRVKVDNLILQFSGQEKDRVLQYRVAANWLKQLDVDGNLIAGALADKYILTKMK